MNLNINLYYSVLKINLFDLIVSFFIKIKLLLPIVNLIKKTKIKKQIEIFIANLLQNHYLFGLL